MRHADHVNGVLQLAAGCSLLGLTGAMAACKTTEGSERQENSHDFFKFPTSTQLHIGTLIQGTKLDSIDYNRFKQGFIAFSSARYLAYSNNLLYELTALA